jgi:hypothetical protein
MRILFACSILSTLLITERVFAGHGFVTAFGNIEWLPEPGRTPDSAFYKLDALQEEGKLLFARDPEAKLRLCLTFAREKLAELEAMVKANNNEAARTAAEWHQTYLKRAKALLNEQTDQSKKEVFVESAANALLEQQYILSVDYPDLPAQSRQMVLQVATDIGKQYQDVVKLLPAKKKGALFFKEEEVRWSLQMAERADEESEETPGK